MNMFKHYSENIPVNVKQTVFDKEERKKLISDCFHRYKRYSDVMTSEIMHDICYNVHNDTMNDCYIEHMQRFEEGMLDKYMTSDMMRAFISQNYYVSQATLMNLPKQLWNEEMAWIVIKKYFGKVVGLPDNVITEEMVDYTIQNNGINYVRQFVSYEKFMILLVSNIRFVENIHEKMLDHQMEMHIIELVKKLTDRDDILFMIKRNPYYIEHVQKNQINSEIAQCVLEKEPQLITHIPYTVLTDAIVWDALKTDKNILLLVPDEVATDNMRLYCGVAINVLETQT